jgi:hypothetical protein
MYVCMIRIKKKDDTEDAIIIVNLRAEKTPDRFFFFLDLFVPETDTDTDTELQAETEASI